MADELQAAAADLRLRALQEKTEGELVLQHLEEMAAAAADL